MMSRPSGSAAPRHGGSMDAIVSFGQWLKQGRQACDLTQEELVQLIEDFEVPE